MKIGDKVQRRPVTFGELPAVTPGEPRTPKDYIGVVVYIHPEGRYHVVEFSLRGGKVRESFLAV